MLHTLIIDGINCIALVPQMKERFPEMYSYIMGWANNNDLIVTEEEEENIGSTTQA